MENEYDIADQIVVCLARLINDGDEVVIGTGTPLPSVAYMLAKLTHAPNAICKHPHGRGIVNVAFPISLTFAESLVLRHAVQVFSSCDAYDVITSGITWRKGHQFVEFLRPAQIDMCGNCNNTVIGDYDSPRVRLPGGAGITDVISLGKEDYFYITRHSARVFVKKVDFVTGVGCLNNEGPETTSKKPKAARVITDLGVFDFHGENQKMRILSAHRGVAIEHILSKTGFELTVPPDVATTEAPTEAEQRTIKEIDPLGIRLLEMFTGEDRTRLLKEIFRRERDIESVARFTSAVGSLGKR